MLTYLITVHTVIKLYVNTDQIVLVCESSNRCILAEAPERLQDTCRSHIHHTNFQGISMRPIQNHRISSRSPHLNILLYFRSKLILKSKWISYPQR